MSKDNISAHKNAGSASIINNLHSSTDHKDGDRVLDDDLDVMGQNDNDSSN